MFVITLPRRRHSSWSSSFEGVDFREEPASLGRHSGAGSKEEKSKDKLAGRCFTFLGSLGRRGLEDLEEGGTDKWADLGEEVIALEEGGADFELAAKETTVELTTWLQEGGADFVEEGADLVEGGADLVGGGADFELAAKETTVELTTWLQEDLDLNFFLLNTFQASVASFGSRPGTCRSPPSPVWKT